MLVIAVLTCSVRMNDAPSSVKEVLTSPPPPLPPTPAHFPSLNEIWKTKKTLKWSPVSSTDDDDRVDGERDIIAQEAYT